MNRVKLAG